MASSLEHYLSLRYRIQLDQDADGSFVAHHPDLSGCIAQGESATEAVAALSEARELWLKVRHEDQLPIPEPVEEPDYSGRLLLRMPKSLHGTLARLAEQEGTSLNQLIVSALSAYAQNPVFGTPLSEDLSSVLHKTFSHLSGVRTVSWLFSPQHRARSPFSYWQKLDVGAWTELQGNESRTMEFCSAGSAISARSNWMAQDTVNLFTAVDEDAALTAKRDDSDEEVVVA